MSKDLKEAGKLLLIFALITLGIGLAAGAIVGLIGAIAAGVSNAVTLSVLKTIQQAAATVWSPFRAFGNWFGKNSIISGPPLNPAAAQTAISSGQGTQPTTPNDLTLPAWAQNTGTSESSGLDYTQQQSLLGGTSAVDLFTGQPIDDSGD